jgi:hypothetical protein
MKKQLETYCEEHWWNLSTKTLSHKGNLAGLLKTHSITFSKRKTEREGIYTFHFKNPYGISFKKQGTIEDFTHLAKQFMQMELVRMGDKSKLYVQGTWRPTVTVNF